MNPEDQPSKQGKGQQSLESKLAQYEQDTFQLQKKVKDLAVENDTLVG